MPSFRRLAALLALALALLQPLAAAAQAPRGPQPPPGYPQQPYQQPYQPAPPPAAGPAQPLAEYALDGDLRDRTGKADGRAVGALRPAEDRRGDPRGALAFEGRSFADLGVRNEPERFTLSAWVRASRLDREQVILSKWSSSPGPRDRWLELRIEPGGRVSLTLPSPGPRPQQLRSARTLVPGRWSFVAATFDGGRATLWVDGAFDGEALLAPFEGSRGPAFLGARPDAGGRRARLGMFFEGRLDDVRIYRDALPDGELQAIALDRPQWPGPGGPGPGPGPGPGGPGFEDRPLLVKLGRLQAAFDAAVLARNTGMLARVESRVLEVLENAGREARREHDPRSASAARRALAEFTEGRNRTDAMSLDRKRTALAGLSEALWDDAVHEVDERPMRDERDDRRPGHDDRRDDWWN